MNLLSRSTIHDLETSGAAFRRRNPFRHVVIENFFESNYANDLLAEFPAFEQGNARNEAGELAGKAVVERIRELGPAYRALDDLVQSRPFLDWLASVTGIPDLLYDPYYFGGGTHENRQGQALDAHVDFNRHPIEPWHRRLNLIVYLNPEWQESWGGTLQLHSDPRSPDDRTLSIVPGFNRCVIFETTEWSWHGFPPISLPAAHADLTRRSIALYFYTTSRPAEELADPHSTVYVDRPLPERFQAGLVLREDDVQELRVLLTRRDMHLQRLYRELQDLGKQRDAAITELHVGLLGRLRRIAGRILRGLGLRR